MTIPYYRIEQKFFHIKNTLCAATRYDKSTTPYLNAIGFIATVHKVTQLK